MTEKKDRDWVDLLADAAFALGFNRVQVRWKLDRLRRRFKEEAVQTKGKVSHVRYRHKICPHCHAINDENATICAQCDHRLNSRAGEVLMRLGILSPKALSVSTLLGVVMVLVYGRMMLYTGGGIETIVSMDVGTLFRFGGSYSAAYHNGEWWRLLTSVFVHAGLWHLGFNLFALSQLGPFVEEIFGRPRMLMYFVFSGIVASLGSRLLSALMAMAKGVPWDIGIAIGASGAIMGLLGVMAGWGQREGTSIGHSARNLALKWAAYTMVFGWIIGADNGAHATGFIVGGVFGLLAKPARLNARVITPRHVFGGLVAALLTLGAAVACLWPIPSRLTASFDKVLSITPDHPPTQVLRGDCLAFEKGNKTPMEDIVLVQASPHLLFPNTDAWLTEQATLLCRKILVDRDAPAVDGDVSQRDNEIHRD